MQKILFIYKASSNSYTRYWHTNPVSKGVKEVSNKKNFIPSSLAVSGYHSIQMAPKPISSPVPEAWYPTLSFFLISFGLAVTAMFFIYEATSSRRNRSLSTELMTGAVASVLLGFGSLFLLLATGVYV